MRLVNYPTIEESYAALSKAKANMPLRSKRGSGDSRKTKVITFRTTQSNKEWMKKHNFTPTQVMNYGLKQIMKGGRDK